MSKAKQEYRQQTFARPPGATEILLVRHGESRAATAEAPFPLVDGQGDPELHPNGREQARRVAQRLRHEKIAAVYVTNLRRTTETAAPLCAANWVSRRSSSATCAKCTSANGKAACCEFARTRTTRSISGCTRSSDGT